MTNDAVEDLQKLGFSEYEGKVYVALLQRNPLNGYEVAKVSGVPRANVYGVLQRLEEQGAVLRLDTPEGLRYSPVPPDDLVEHLGRQYRGALMAVQSALDVVAKPREREYVWNLQGYESLLQHGRTLLRNAKETLLLATWPEESLALAEDVERTQASGVDVTTLCLAECPQECGACRGRIYRYSLAEDSAVRWLVLITDGAEMIAAEIGPAEEAHAIRSRQDLLVQLAGWYIRHSIALAAVINDLGSRLDGLLGQEVRNTLASSSLGFQRTGWLEHMRHLLNRPKGQAD